MTATFLNTTNTAGLNAAVFFIWFYIFWWCFFVDATQYVSRRGSPIFLEHTRNTETDTSLRCRSTLARSGQIIFVRKEQRGVSHSSSSLLKSRSLELRLRLTRLVGSSTCLSPLWYYPQVEPLLMNFDSVLIIPSVIYITCIYFLFPVRLPQPTVLDSLLTISRKPKAERSKKSVPCSATTLTLLRIGTILAKWKRRRLLGKHYSLPRKEDCMTK